MTLTKTLLSKILVYATKQEERITITLSIPYGRTLQLGSDTYGYTANFTGFHKYELPNGCSSSYSNIHPVPTYVK